MKRYLFSFIVLATSTIMMAQNNPRDYYYPMDMTLIEAEYLNVGIEARSRQIKYDFINFTRVVDRRVIANRGFNLNSFRDVDIDYVEGNTLFINRTRSNGSNESSMDGYIVYKLPKGNETIHWVNTGRTDQGISYHNNGESKKITIQYKGMTLQALRVTEWEEYDDGAKSSTVFWVKNWGDALKFSDDGTIMWMNKTLFDSDIKDNAAFINAIERMKAIDIETRTPKVYNEGKVSFKPVSIPSELKNFALDLKKAILERKDLSPYLGGELLDYYQSKIPYGDNATESFAIYMRDPYFSGLDELATLLDIIESSCSIEHYGADGEITYYVLPCYSKCIYQYKSDEKIYKGKFIRRPDPQPEIGVVYQPIKIYKKADVDSKVKYTAEPYHLLILNNRYMGTGTCWYTAYTLDEEELGYVLDKDIYLFNHNQFAFSKEDGKYKLSLIPSCNISDEQFKYEQEMRQMEKNDFQFEHKNDSYDINTISKEAGALICNGVESSIVKTLQQRYKAAGIPEKVFTIEVSVKCFSHDRVEVNYEGDISLTDEPIINAAEECYDKGYLKPATLLFEKYNYEIPLPGLYKYKDTFKTTHITATFTLKKNEWIPDKNSVEIYKNNKTVCDYLLNEMIQSNPKIKKTTLDLIKIGTSNGYKYCNVEKVVKIKNQQDKYILGTEILYK